MNAGAGRWGVPRTEHRARAAFVVAVLALAFGLSLAGHLLSGPRGESWSAEGLARLLEGNPHAALAFEVQTETAITLLALVITLLAGGRGLLGRDREALALGSAMAVVSSFDLYRLGIAWGRSISTDGAAALARPSTHPDLGAWLLLAVTAAFGWWTLQKGARTFLGLGVVLSSVPQALARLESWVSSQAIDAAAVLAQGQRLLAYATLLGGLLLGYLASLRQGKTVQVQLSRQIEQTGQILALNSRALAESEAKYHALLDSANDLIQSVTPAGRFEFVNRAWREALGYRAHEVEQLEVWDVIHPRFHAYCEDALRRTQAGEELSRIEVALVTQSGAEIAVEGSLTPRLEAGRPAGTLGIFRDISERLRIDRMKSEFISTLGHELRTPLTSIIAALGLLEGGRLPGGEERARELLAVAHRNSQRLLQLINDLLDLQRLAVGKMRFDLRPLPVASVVEEAVRGMQAFADTRPVFLTLAVIEPGLRVMADEARLLQVLGNLLSNAIKFSPEGGEVAVAAGSHDGRVTVSVRDQGPGIPSELHHRLFDQFSQMTPATSRVTGGSGLGLSIVKRLVEGMGGTVTCESDLGRGAAFSIDLPRALETGVPPAAGTRPLRLLFPTDLQP